MTSTPTKWTLELENKPDFDQAMERIYAWYEQEIIDRPPVRFTAHNADFSAAHVTAGRHWKNLKERWFDADYQIEYFIQSIKGQAFRAETFPVYWPNLGPEIFAAFFGSELIFQEVTSYSVPFVREWKERADLRLNMTNPYFLKIEELMETALARCQGRFMVGYTDLHGGMDCAAAWRDPQQLCLDLLLAPEHVKELSRIAALDFQTVFDHFDRLLKKHRQLSVTWMGIPSFCKMHIPSCDFAAMISPQQFEKFCLPLLQAEVQPMTHNIFHVDGKGVARHIDAILAMPEVHAVQWVQGMGLDEPIMQWVPFLKKIQAAGKSMVIDLQLAELEDFMSAMDPHGIYLCIAADDDLQLAVIKRIEKWSASRR